MLQMGINQSGSQGRKLQLGQQKKLQKPNVHVHAIEEIIARRAAVGFGIRVSKAARMATGCYGGGGTARGGWAYAERVVKIARVCVVRLADSGAHFCGAEEECEGWVRK
jgi:hypothetical protein